MTQHNSISKKFNVSQLCDLAEAGDESALKMFDDARLALERCFQEDPSDQIKRFLELLRKDPSSTRIRGILPKGNHNDRGRKGKLSQHLIKQWQSEGRSIYAVIGNNGDTDKSITSCPAVFIEHDDRSRIWQLDCWRDLGLPEPTVQIDTGHKSIHSYWVLDQPLAPEQWRDLQKRLLNFADADRSINNPSRVMRLPGTIHPKTGKPCQIANAAGARYSVEEISKAIAKPKELPDLSNLLSRDQEQLVEKGAQEGDRNSQCFRLAVGTIAVENAARAAGIKFSGCAEEIVRQFAARCEPPLEEDELIKVLRSAESRSPEPDPGWPGRERFWLRQQQGQESAPRSSAIPEGSRDARFFPGPRHRLKADQVLSNLPWVLGGKPRLNIRTGDVYVADQVLGANDIGRLYVRLSTSAATWPKEATSDALQLIAKQNQFDPVQDYLETMLRVDPLPMKQWQRLDRFLLGIDDPIAAAFLPRYLVSAVARIFEPGASIRQTPVLVGPQWRGKSALGRILFGVDYWTEGLEDLGRDALMKCRTAWGVELAELDGVTRRADQEKLKAFLTERIDTYRAPYERAPERHPRRFVFWATSNGSPLRDATGSTRFVCIRISDRMLPLAWAKEHRDAIWARAVEQYQVGVQWDVCDESERDAIAGRNCDFTEIDPWTDQVLDYLKLHTPGPVKSPDLLEFLGVPVERRNNQLSARVRQIAEQAGWEWGRRRVSGGQRLAGLWAPQSGHSGHTDGHATGHSEDPSNSKGSAVVVTPDISKTKELTQMGELKPDGVVRAGTNRAREGSGLVGVAGVPRSEVNSIAMDLVTTPPSSQRYVQGSSWDIDAGDDPHWGPRKGIS